VVQKGNHLPQNLSPLTAGETGNLMKRKCLDTAKCPIARTLSTSSAIGGRCWSQDGRVLGPADVRMVNA